MFDWHAALFAIIACSLVIGLLGVLWFLVCLARWLLKPRHHPPEPSTVWLSARDIEWIERVSERLEA